MLRGAGQRVPDRPEDQGLQPNRDPVCLQGDYGPAEGRAREREGDCQSCRGEDQADPEARGAPTQTT